MYDKATKRSGGTALMIVFVVLLIFLPMLYVLSIGPAAWLVNTGRLNGDEGSAAYRFYSPIIWAANSYPPIERVLGWYYSLWEPQAPISYPSPPASAPAQAAAARSRP